jgi:hypothetical protein
MESFDIADDRDYWVEFYVVDEKRNHVVTKRIKSTGEYTNKLYFTAAEGFDNYPAKVSEGDTPVYGNILSVMYGEKTSTLKLWEASRYLVADLSENDVGYNLTLVPYNKAIYETTSKDDIPEYKSSILSPAPVVYEDQERKELANRVDELRERTRPENINVIARNVVAGSSPGFRRVYYEIGYIDEEGRGVIGGDIMNPGDYVYYAGEDAGEGTDRWLGMYIYQWTGEKWIQKPRPSDDTESGWMYMDAATSIGEGRPLGIFSDVFCQALTADAAFIKNLYMQQGVLRGNGSIQSEDYIPNISGFIIKNSSGLIYKAGPEWEDFSPNGTITNGILKFSSGGIPLNEKEFRTTGKETIFVSVKSSANSTFNIGSSPYVTYTTFETTTEWNVFSYTFNQGILINSIFMGGGGATHEISSLIILDENSSFIECKNGRFRGHIDANSGTFNEVTGTKLNIVSGTIDIGPLFVSDDKTTPSKDQVYGATDKLVGFVNKFLPDNPVMTGPRKITTTVTAYYGGKYDNANLYKIDFTKEWKAPYAAAPPYLFFTAEFYTSSSNKPVVVETSAATLQSSQNNTATIGKPVIIKGGGAGKTFLLRNVPSYNPGVSGSVWKDPDSNALYIVP